MNVAEVIIRVVELLEAEGRLLRRNTLRTAMVIAAIGVLTLVMLGGVVLLFVSLYLRVQAWSDDIAAALTTGAVGVLVALGGAYGVWRWLDRDN